MFRWIIVNYHYVHNTKDYPFKNLKGNTPDQFRKQVRKLKNIFRVLPAGAVISECKLGKPSDYYCTICFDDGIRDIYDFAMPILKEEGISGTFFISSSPFFERKVLSVQKIHLLMGEIGVSEFRNRFMHLLEEKFERYELNDLERYRIKHTYRYDTPEAADFKMKLNFLLPYDVRDTILDEIFVSYFGDESEISSKIYIQQHQIEEMQSSGMEIGSHFHTHSVMTFLTEIQQRREVERGVEFIKRFSNGSLLFSYPFGTENVWSETTLSALSRHKVDASFSMGRRVATDFDVKENRCLIPRYSTDDIFIHKTDKLLPLPELSIVDSVDNE